VPVVTRVGAPLILTVAPILIAFVKSRFGAGDVR
jgi:hypothetical protein